MFAPAARRIVVYVLALQIVLGAATWLTVKVAPPAAHWVLAILAGGVWPMGRVLERRGRPKAAAMAVYCLAVVILAYVIELGMHGLRAATG